MLVSSAPQISATSLLWQPRPSTFVLTLVLKTTYALQPGESPLIVPDKPSPDNRYWEDGRQGSLQTPSDLVPYKRYADVLVSGHAYAPRGQPVTSLVARVAVGEVNKAVEVHGDRFWMPDGRLSMPSPFTKMPLRWERASGGPGTWNPAGVPANPPPDARNLRPTPNLLPVGAALQSPAALLPPACFGPLAPHWPERAAKLRWHAPSWPHEAWNARPVPEDLDAAYFNAAPPDQIAAQLPAELWITLEHLHPDLPRLTTLLEGTIPRAVLQRAGAEQELRLRCDTLWIDTDRKTCTLTWRCAVPLQHPREEGVVLVTPVRTGAKAIVSAQAPAARPAQPLVQTAPQAPVPPQKRTQPMLAVALPNLDDKAPTHTVAPALSFKAAAPLPFQPSNPPSTPPASTPPADAPAKSAVPPRLSKTLVPPLERVPRKPALPFATPPVAPSAPAPTPPAAATPPAENHDDDSGRKTVVPALVARSAAALPFKEDDGGTATVVPALVARSAAALPFKEDDGGTATVVPALVARSAAALPFKPATPGDPAQPDASKPRPRRPTPVPVPVDDESTQTFARPPPQAVPPLPFTPAPAAAPAEASVAEPPASSPLPFKPASAPAAASAAEPVASSPLPFRPVLGSAFALGTPAPAPPVLASPEPPPPPSARPANEDAETGLTLERYAKIKAELWGSRSALHEVLERHGIDEITWRNYERTQADALATEAREGRSDLALAVAMAFEAARQKSSKPAA
ncbi:DUF2169 family type VI secretion system accessory protein [Polyangium aurulentum]|uniref:DUF2169 family type VI secretion system accessory protein n=1 Tax=Polyangium aurulentum TaxID=2567896 RepID=UPI0010AE114B|nr:DUF2169 domain-containing protein [Polyangium aurulentum]UQA63160.1 DUF2169 domain-containing protein [Polyangium aurulentum]